MKLTVTQRVLRPILNFLVERFFPEGAFFGDRYLHDLDSDSVLSEKWGTVDMACVMYVTSNLRKQGVTDATFEASDVTNKGEPVGSWRIVVKKIEQENDK